MQQPAAVYMKQLLNSYSWLWGPTVHFTTTYQNCIFVYLTKALDGSLKKDGGDWATRHGGKGSWFLVQFDDTYDITYARIMQRFFKGEQFNQIMLEFSDGSQMKVLYELFHSYVYQIQTYKLKPIDRIHAITRIRPWITDTQTNTFDW